MMHSAEKWLPDNFVVIEDVEMYHFHILFDETLNSPFAVVSRFAVVGVVFGMRIK